MLSDEQKAEIATCAKGWRHPVSRGDVSARYAAQEVVGHFCRPYLSAAEARAVFEHALKYVGKCRRS